MKRYKELKRQLNETEQSNGGALGGYPDAKGSRSAFSDYGVHRIENPEQLQRLKAFLNAFSGREYLEPRAALSLLRVKLNLAGLDFEYNNKTDIKINQTMLLKLTRFGGTFGTSPNHDLSQGFEVTDGFDGIPLGLAVTILESDSGLYTLKLDIIRHDHDNYQNDRDIKIETT